MNNTVPTPEPEVSPIVATIISWLPWAVALVAAAAIVWALVALHRSGRLKVMVSRAKSLMVKRAAPTPRIETPAAPEAIPADSTNGTTRSTSTWIIVAAASVPSVLSLVWLASTVAEITGGPGGWAAGIFADVVIVSTVAIAWFNPEVRKVAGMGGWAAAVAAGLLLGWHHWGTEEVAFSLVPIGSKFLWHIALMALTAREKRVALLEQKKRERAEEAKKAAAEAERLAEEEKARQEAELSPELTFEQKRTIAERQRDAAYEKELAAADREVDAAKKDTEHQRKLAEIRLLGEQQRAMDEESANVEIARQDLIRKVNASRPASFPLPSGEIPNDLSSLPAPPASPRSPQVMGFGAAMGSDQRTSPGRPGGVPVVADPQLRELVAYIAAAGDKASVRGAAAELKVSAPTIRRWREKAEAQGLNMSALRRRSQ